MDWRRGVTMLWTLFGLVALGEAANGAIYLLCGYAGWPLRYDLLRICVGAVGFIMLWIGWGWTRWLLAVTDVLAGLWLLVWAIANHGGRAPAGIVYPGAPADSGLEALPKMALGIVYLGAAIYLAFSADLLDFLRHRREEGRGWVVAPVTILTTACVAALILMPLPYAVWLGFQSAWAERFGKTMVRDMATRWMPESVNGHFSEELVKTWPLDFQRESFEVPAPLGPLQTLNEVKITAMGTGLNRAGNWFQMRYSFQARQARFAHGTGDVALFIVKPVFGQWQIDNWAVGEIHFDSDQTTAAPSAP